MMKAIKYSVFVILSIVLIISVSCSKESTETVCDKNDFMDLTYIDDIMPIFTMYCSIPEDPQGFGCHVPGGRANTDFLQFDVIQSNLADIKNRVQSGNMPRSNSGLTLSENDINMIVCWVNNGASEN